MTMAMTRASLAYGRITFRLFLFIYIYYSLVDKVALLY